jgi:signal transduction histidine kinase
VVIYDATGDFWKRSQWPLDTVADFEPRIVNTKMAGFSVDTKLFRELGELLVGRDSTALVELIKNAYDADATEVIVEGRDFATSQASIVVRDNGIGMNTEEFQAGFLTIGGRTKTEGSRRSRWFKRRYTGEKGVGRLAAHKLGHCLSVVSRRWDDGKRDEVEGFRARNGIRAVIDWDAIERLKTLAEIEKSESVKLENLALRQPASRWAGTRLSISPLRKSWTDGDIDSFFSEVMTLTPPAPLVDQIPKGLITEAPLLSKIDVRDSENGTDRFTVKYEGDLRSREADIPAVAKTASWIIEIDWDSQSKKLAVLVAPTVNALDDYPSAQAFRFRNILVDRKAPSFQARIFQRTNHAWPRVYSGVRIYHEGFRVLPYGDPRDDWLDLDKDYRSRAKGRLQSLTSWEVPEGKENEGLVIQGNNSLFGAVFLTSERASAMKMLVNREGFVPGPELESIAEIVRLAIDLQVRQRYAASSATKQNKKYEDASVAEQKHARQRHAARTADPYQTPTTFLMNNALSEASRDLREAREEMQSGHAARASAILSNIDEKIADAMSIARESGAEVSMYRVLASMGLEQAAFVHEVNALALLAQGITDAVLRCAEAVHDSATARALKRIGRDAKEIRERLRRNAIYLADMTGIEGRRRRSRQNLTDAFEGVLENFREAIRSRGIAVENNIPNTLQTLPIFPAELKAIMSNFLSNAVKFAGKDGRIAASGRQDAGDIVFRLENSGAAVDLANSSIWFEPFRSTTQDVDESLGQGMGLGLTITRSMVNDYGGAVAFVRPSRGYATAIEARLPSK